ncbi:MAG: 2Fe-2S iron-sulfur cluster binding domain-containing protein [Lentisphaerae bacterium]|nr:2Fe-2S iron-sulfur cluster binding domain-containing protein [Lentisphaerota bacterium]
MLLAFLVSVGVACGITSLLAILMVIAEATIANYGECTITVNDSRELKVEGGRSLLSTLKDEKIFIPSACGGRGSCGLCTVTVAEGAGDPLPTELPWLSPEQRKTGVRLSCQVKVKNDLRILIPEELFNVTQYTAEVVSIRDLTHDIKEVQLSLLDPPEMSFKAGQFMQFEVPEYELTEEPVYRAYSLSSAPSSQDTAELEIRYVPGGICTTYVHQHLEKGDKVTINGPYGDFHLQETDREILFIAGGSGMAPVKSILLDMAEHGNARRTRYFFGAKSLRDLFLVEEMRELEKRLPSFEFVPALSEPLPEDHWSGETGLITEVVNRHIDNGNNLEAYLCGSPLMIDACIEVLKDKGVEEEQIYYDKFA